MKITAIVPVLGLVVPVHVRALQEAAEEAAEGGSALFSVDIGLAIWTIAVFLIVLWVLGKYGWSPILGALESREEGIRSSIDEAKQMRDEAASLLAEHKQQLAEARKQAQDIVSQGREAGERVRADIEAKAREEGDRMLVRARSEIEREKERALEALRRESVELAMAAAAALLDRKLDSETDRALVVEYLDELDRPAAEA